MSAVSKKMLQAAAGAAGGAPEFLGYVGQTTLASSLSLTSLNLQAGDLVIFSITADSDTFIDPAPSGYTGMHSGYPDSVLDSIGYAVGYKVMGSPPDSSISLPDPDPSGPRFQAVAFRNVGTPSTTPDSSQSSATGNIFNISNISVSNDDSVVFFVAAIDDNNSTLTLTAGDTQAGIEQISNRGSTALVYRTGVSSGTLSSGTRGIWSTVDSVMTLAWVIPPA